MFVNKTLIADIKLVGNTILFFDYKFSETCSSRVETIFFFQERLM